MDVRIKALHFEIADRLVDFINKKADRFARRFPTLTTFDVNLKLVKPETAKNKEVMVLLSGTQLGEIVATKVADTFEEAFDSALEAAERQLEKSKDRN